MAADVRFNITVEQFRPMGIMNCTITMEVVSPAQHEKILELVGSYHIRMKPKPTGHAHDTNPNMMTLTFVLSDPKYLLMGIVFSKRRTNKDDPDLRGRQAFPMVQIAYPAPGVSEMSVTNTRFQKASYDYSIVLQNVETGVIGCIDPEIENEN